jgi:3-phenylpropionate/cinnamic acid dioxygenase small subunit
LDPDALIDDLLIRRVLARYCHLVDDNQLDELVQLFTADAVFSWGELSATGRDDLRAWLQRNHPPHRRGKHLTTNTVVDLDGDRADAVSDFVFLGFRNDRLVPVYTGRYHDRLVRTQGSWLIRRRDAVQLHAPPASPPDP